jgi:hypothetical protein
MFLLEMPRMVALVAVLRLKEILLAQGCLVRVILAD